jgi:hypothetical protein
VAIEIIPLRRVIETGSPKGSNKGQADLNTGLGALQSLHLPPRRHLPIVGNERATIPARFLHPQCVIPDLMVARL